MKLNGDSGLGDKDSISRIKQYINDALKEIKNDNRYSVLLVRVLDSDKAKKVLSKNFGNIQLDMAFSTFGK